MCVEQPASNLQHLTEIYFTFISELEFTELNSFTFAQGQCHGQRMISQIFGSKKMLQLKFVKEK